MKRGQALLGPHGEVAEFIKPCSYFEVPGAAIRRMAGTVVIPASQIGDVWKPVPGRVYTAVIETGRWTTPEERYLAIAVP